MGEKKRRMNWFFSWFWLRYAFYFSFYLSYAFLFVSCKIKQTKSFIYNPKNSCIVMEISIDLGEPGFVLEDLTTWVAHHSDGAIIDGDRNTITITDPDREFLAKLEARGIRYVRM